MEICISEYNEKKIVVLLDNEMKIVKPVYDYLRFQQQKGRATNTLKAYGTDLCLFWTFLKKNGYAYDQVAPRLIVEFIDYLRGGDEMLSLYRESIRSNRTINRILSTVHSFYQYQADVHEIDNPIEEDGSVIHIRQAVNLVKGSVHVGVPKSRDSYRDIPVPSNLWWCAKELRNVDTKYIWEKRKRDTPCNPSNFRDEFKEAIAQIEGVRVLTPHSCRHTYVSQMQALGVDLATIQSIVGHADVDMTEHYLHVQDGIRQEAIRKFANAFPVDGQPPDDPESDKRRIIQFRRIV